MKKLALVHKGWFAATAVTDRWRCLFEAMRDECGFELRFIEGTTSAPAADVTLFSCAAGHFNDKRVRSLYGSCVGKKIVYLADYQPEVQRHATSALKKADVILAPEAALYRRIFPDKRIEFFPYFFAPQARYMELAWNEKPDMRCLVSGPLNRSYPLRLAAATYPLASALPHTGSHGAQLAGAVVRDEYARRLNRHYCAVAGALRGGITTKTFEIMAAGALLLNEPIADLGEAGLVAGVHYVASLPSTIGFDIKNIVEKPGEYDGIRYKGMEYARANHGIINRMAQFKRLLETL